jgi:hypothetical protein
MGHSLQGQTSGKSGHVRYAAEGGSGFRAINGFAASYCWLDGIALDVIQAPKTGASDYAQRTQRLWMGRDQADATQQAARRSAGKWPSRTRINPKLVTR